MSSPPRSLSLLCGPGPQPPAAAAAPPPHAHAGPSLPSWWASLMPGPPGALSGPQSLLYAPSRPRARCHQLARGRRPQASRLLGGPRPAPYLLLVLRFRLIPAFKETLQGVGWLEERVGDPQQGQEHPAEPRAKNLHSFPPWSMTHQEGKMALQPGCRRLIVAPRCPVLTSGACTLSVERLRGHNGAVIPDHPGGPDTIPEVLVRGKQEVMGSGLC